MLKLATVHGYYDPVKFIRKSSPQTTALDGPTLFEYLNNAYRHAIRKILLAHPASFSGDSQIYDLCIDVILNNNDMSRITVKWIENQINYNKDIKKLRYLQSDDADFKKLQLIKTVTNMHQSNLAISDNVVPYVNSILMLENILNTEYKYGFFSSSEKSAPAITALKDALQEEPVNLLLHLPVLRKDYLGGAIRDFVQQGLADNLLDGQSVKTVSAFIEALHKQVNPDTTVTLER